MQKQQFTYVQFLRRIFVMNIAGFKVIDSNTGHVIYRAHDKPYTTKETRAAFYSKLYADTLPYFTAGILTVHTHALNDQ